MKVWCLLTVVDIVFCFGLVGTAVVTDLKEDQALSPLRQKRWDRGSMDSKDKGMSEYFHQAPCTKEEVRKTACIKGECYALDMAGMRSPFCQCPEMYEGLRCEKISAYFYLAEVRKGAIIGGVVFGVIVIIVCISVTFTCWKRRQNRL